MAAWKTALPTSVRTGATPSSCVHSSFIVPAPSSPPRHHLSATSAGPSHHSSDSAEPEMKQPLILSLALDEKLHSHLTSLRTKYFPSARNHLQGHITLFHALPATYLSDLLDTLTSLTHAMQPFNVHVKPPVLRGGKEKKAVFVPLQAAKLRALRSDLLRTFSKDLKMPLTDQDRNPTFWPHATIVNKVTAEEAENVFEELNASGEVSQRSGGEAEGLDLWWYRGGPWEHIRTFHFGPNAL
ncbi:MAG: hypothetical protein CYPHOPRED_001819 [Cyphobasidiales sp. Tagirdzhanova-0007]|nr:MAG: hypothetical protein CYPHOPRED_001819 [Cyphobasidiales sp. Tagirdzhanova-0007]